MDTKVALVTGAGSGIGRATALEFARKEYRTVICDNDEEELRKVASELEQLGGEYLSRQCDITSEEQVAELVANTIERFQRLDVACNNAGIEGERVLTADCSSSEWDRLMNVNLRGQWLCMKYEIPQMLDKGGAIINISSILGVVGYRQAPVYTAAKHGLIGLTRAAALDYAENNIRVNAVCPAFIETPMLERAGITSDQENRKLVEGLHPLGRLGSPEEVANAVIWLASDEASFVTGHSLLVDGGYVIQ